MPRSGPPVHPLSPLLGLRLIREYLPALPGARALPHRRSVAILLSAAVREHLSSSRRPRRHLSFLKRSPYQRFVSVGCFSVISPLFWCLFCVLNLPNHFATGSLLARECPAIFLSSRIAVVAVPWPRTPYVLSLPTQRNVLFIARAVLSCLYVLNPAAIAEAQPPLCPSDGPVVSAHGVQLLLPTATAINIRRTWSSFVSSLSVSCTHPVSQASD